ncbi:TPA: oligosaccharide flippase family protein [Streptococcus suis]|nr:oligosaccharide flippase family protein [Streptococcus suis]
MSVSKLVKSGFIYTLGAVLIQGLSLITTPIYTRIISQEVYGQYSLYNSWVALISLFIGMQTVGSLPIAKVKYADEYNRYVAHALSLSTLVFLTIFSLAFLFKSYISIYIEVSESIFLLIVTQSFIGYVAGFLGQYFIQLQRAKENLLLSAIVAISSVILSLYLLQIMQDDFLARIYGGLFPAIGMAVVTYFYIYTRGRNFVRKEYIRFTLTISLPLVFHHLGGQLLGHLGRIMIGQYTTSRDVALYSFGSSLGAIIQLVLGNINIAWVPWHFEAKRTNNPDLSRYVFNFLSLSLFLTLGYLTIFPELAFLMGGEKYSDSIEFIALIIFSHFLGFLYTFPMNIQFYHGNTKFVPVATLVSGFLNGALNLYFIPNYGNKGAAMATTISYMTLVVFHYAISRKVYNYNEVSLQFFVVLSAVSGGYAYLMNFFITSLCIRWSIGFVVIIIYTLIFRKELEAILWKFKEKS